MTKRKSPTEIEFRKRAESRLKGSRVEKQVSSNSDPVRLLHDLQVHQIELELQNEELRMQRDRAEEATQKYSELYSEIYDFTPVAYFSFSKDGEIREANLKACELLGVERSKLLNRNFKFFLTADSRQVFSWFLRDVFSDLTRKKCEVQIIRNNISAYAIMEGAVSEKEDRCLAMVSDITELKKAEEALKLSEKRLHSLLVASSELLYSMNSDWSEMLQLNSRGFLPNTEKPNQNWLYDYIPVADHTLVISKINEAIREKGVFELQHRVNLADGSVGWVYSRAIPILDTKGEIIEWFGTASNISVRKEAEERLIRKQNQLTKAKLALQRSQKKLTLALENGKIGLWEWNVVKNITTWDRRMEEMFGLEPGTFDGKLSTFENLVHEDDLPQMRITMEKALSEGSSMQMVYRTKERDGKSNYIMSTAIVRKDKFNRPASVIGVCFDVTKIQEGAEKHIVKINEDLLRSNNDLRQFAYIASHDLQEPLRMVSSFVQMLQKRYEDKLDDDGKEYIKYAVEGAKRMYELLNGLLAYSRVQTREHEFSSIDMKEVVKKVTDNLSLVISESKAEVYYDDLPVVIADENQIVQVMQNLIENGIKFSKGKPKIRISGSEYNNYEHLIKVADEGIGIEPQYHERIFRIFQRLHLASDYKGTGIGLAICKRIIERHGGRIWVESAPGKGSAFCFTLPKGS
jgi:two-component system, chemotaxis family, sensor kinase Cph1